MTPLFSLLKTSIWAAVIAWGIIGCMDLNPMDSMVDKKTCYDTTYVVSMDTVKIKSESYDCTDYGSFLKSFYPDMGNK